MAGRRGYWGSSVENLYGGRDSEDLTAAAENLTDMLRQLKGPAGRRGRGASARAPRRDGWRPNFAAHQEPRYSPRPEWRRRDRSCSLDEYDGDHWELQEHHPAQEQGGWRGRGQAMYELAGRWRPTPRGSPTRGRPPARGQGGWRQPPQRPDGQVTPQQLVEVLADSAAFSLNLLHLMEEHGLPPRAVRATVSAHPNLFCLRGEAVELVPQLELCGAHSGPSGCQARSACSSIHICPKFVLNWCKEKEACVLGHRWHTDHNLAILKRLSMEYVHFPKLRQLLRRRHQGAGHTTAKPLGVCYAYNGNGCEQPRCPHLHVCLSFVVGLTVCSRSDCHLNHDLVSPACCHLLKLHQLPVNEAPRDVAMALLQANPKLAQTKIETGVKSCKQERTAKIEAQSAKASAQRQKKRDSGKDTPCPTKQPTGVAKQRHDQKDRPSTSDEIEDDFSSSDSEGSSEKNNQDEKEKTKSRGRKSSRKTKQQKTRSGRRSCLGTSSDSVSSAPESGSEGSVGHRSDKRERKAKKSPRKEETSQSQNKKEEAARPPPSTPHRTVWSHYLQGDVPAPEICFSSVESMCQLEESGCPRLHSSEHFHWQVKEPNGRWLNLPPAQVLCLERSFCDPGLDGVDIPRLDPSKLERSMSGLFLLLGRDIWHAHFPAASLTNSAKTKTLLVRRLRTQPVTGQTIKAATYQWYFQDINKSWVKYGSVDSAGKIDLVSSITSDEIEKHYKQNPSQQLSFQNSKFLYVLDFLSMKQTNQQTKVSREVRRRPEPHLPEEEGKEKKEAASELPQHWEKMNPEERSRLVTLVPSSTEYQTVVGLLTGNVSAAVMKVQRIQNPFMWRALQNKIKDMTALYKDPAKVDVRQLFHGTSHNVVASICAENFDWRLHGSASGQSFGRGTYFATDASYSYGYCRADSKGLKYLFVARTAVGSMTQGSSSMVRPPINPATSMPYDSTTNHPTNPSIIVKYSTQEYYPEYLLTLT